MPRMNRTEMTFAEVTFYLDLGDAVHAHLYSLHSEWLRVGGQFTAAAESMTNTLAIAAKQIRSQYEWVEKLDYQPGHGELVECRAQYRQLYKTITSLIVALEGQGRLSRKPKLVPETKPDNG